LAAAAFFSSLSEKFAGPGRGVYRVDPAAYEVLEQSGRELLAEARPARSTDPAEAHRCRGTHRPEVNCHA
jgi:hypothetical protein